MTAHSFKEYLVDGYSTLIKRIIELKPLIALGEVSIKPGTIIHEDYDGHSWNSGEPDEETVDYLYLVDQLTEKRFIPLLAKKEVSGLSKVFQKDIYLPYIKNIELSELAKIKQNETDAFRNFQFKMSRIFSDLKDIDDESKIRYIMEETEHKVQKIESEFRKTQTLKSLEKTSIGIFIISIVSLIAGTENINKLVSLVLGAPSLTSILKIEKDRKLAELSLRKSDFFIAWKLHRQAN